MEQMISPYLYAGLKFKPFSTISHRKDVNLIVNVVCRHYCVTPEELKQKTRKRTIREPRQIISFLIRRNLPMVSLKEIGALFSDQDHTTIMHSVKAIQNMIDTEEEMRHKVRTIESEI